LDSYGRLKRLEVRTTIAILHDSLTINDCGFAAETGSSANDAGIAVAPIMSIPAKDTRLAALNHHLRAVAIVFDFMNPVLALRRLIDRGSKMRLDKLSRLVTRNMGLRYPAFFSGSDFSCAFLSSKSPASVSHLGEVGVVQSRFRGVRRLS
jgi:hypothetical protein